MFQVLLRFSPWRYVQEKANIQRRVRRFVLMLESKFKNIQPLNSFDNTVSFEVPLK